MDDKIDIRKLKSEMEIFFNKKFRNCLKIMNKNNNENWFYVQASKKLPPFIHYEYLDGKVNLHIETDDIELNKFIKNYLEDKTGKTFESQQYNGWYTYTHKNNGDIKNSFKEIQKDFKKTLNNAQFIKIFNNKRFSNIYFNKNYTDKSKNVVKICNDNCKFLCKILDRLLILGLLLPPIILYLINKNNAVNTNLILYYIFSTFFLLFITSTFSFIHIINSKKMIKEQKQENLKKIIEISKFESISKTNTVYEDDKIKSITSSDQQAKVLIAAIEAIKDL